MQLRDEIQLRQRPPADPAPSLSLAGFGVAYGEQVVLSDVNLDVPSQGVLTLVGPTGTGKSTLLRTVAGFNRQLPSLRTWGASEYLGRALDQSHRPALVGQNSRLLASTLLDNLLYRTPRRLPAKAGERRAQAVALLERVGLGDHVGQLERRAVELPPVVQRLVAIARELPANPPLLLIDEPTAGLDEADAAKILDAVRREGRRRAVVIVLHNQRQARSLGGMTALLAGGIVQECQTTKDFFEHPLTSAGEAYCATGTCSEPSPNARPEELSAEMRGRLHPPPLAARLSSTPAAPRDFAWLLPGRLAGTPRPGVFAALDDDLDALRRLGVTDLLSPTVREPDWARLADYGIDAHWYLIPDAVAAPSFESAVEICLQIDGLLQKKKIVAVHCRGGLGRTGTVLVAYSIWCGRSVMHAVETARRIEPKWVQTDLQLQFLEEFADRLREHRGDCPDYQRGAA